MCLSSFALFQKRAESNRNQSCPKNIRRLCLKAGHVGLDPADLTASHTHVWAAVISVLLGLTQRGQLSLKIALDKIKLERALRVNRIVDPADDCVR